MTLLPRHYQLVDCRECTYTPFRQGGAGTMQIAIDFLFSRDMLTAVTGGVIGTLLIALFWVFWALLWVSCPFDIAEPDPLGATPPEEL
jgi:hypothetical protein